MAVDLTYILTLSAAGDKTFVMPAGFEANVEIHCWGAGGGGFGTVSESRYQRTVYYRSLLATGYSGSGETFGVTTTTQTITVPPGVIPPASSSPVAGATSYGPWTLVSGGSSGSGAKGGGGGYASTVAQIPAGSTVRLQVGQPGTNGGRQTGGVGGTHPTYTRYRGGSAGSAYDEDWDTGAGGGGGGASAVVVDNSPVCVGAGGGGAGGPGDDSPIGSQGNPGGVYPGQATNIYPVTLSYAWCQFMNDYAVWGPFGPYTTTVNFPSTGIYTFAFAVDNFGNVQVDGVQVVSSSSFTSVTYANVSVSSGNRTITVYATNTGGPAGVAVRILKPDLSELDNSRNYTVGTGLTNSNDGGTSVNAWTSGGGGGGGYYGGQAGTSYGDDSGNAPGGNGGQNYGNITIAGSGATGAGKSTPYYPRTLVRVSSQIARYQKFVSSRFQLQDGGAAWPVGTALDEFLELTNGIPPGTTPGKVYSADYPSGLPVYFIGPQPNPTAIERSSSWFYWKPITERDSTPVAYIGDAGYPGYIVMVFTRSPGLQIKNPNGSGNWVTVQSSYVRTEAPRPSIAADNRVFSTIGTSSYTIPREVRSLTLTYLTSTGFQSQLISVVPGQTLPVTVGDFGQNSSFGDFTIPAYNKQVFRYVGRVDHLLNADVQVVNASGNPLTTAGYNAAQTAAAAAAGLYYNVTYEGWHGDLYSTLSFNPVPTSQLLNNFRIVPSGGGRGGVPTVPTQPTVANSYRMSIQMYDGSGDEGDYDSRFTLQQQGWFRIEYNLPIVISGWKDIQNIYVKNGEVWKSISQRNDIVIYNY
jgi:hypothetical protein